MFDKNILYVIGIPIGNIFDFSQRAIFILKNVNIIATEDSRKSGILLKFLNIKNKLISLNKHNEIFISYLLLKNIKNGLSIALISDSGTPLLSDPGFFLINLFYKNNIKISPVPGISSITTIISVSMLNINKFIFSGFLPKNLLYKTVYLKQFLFEKRTVIFFDVSNRLEITLSIMKKIYSNNRKILIANNLTKLYEKIDCFELKNLNLYKKKYNSLASGEIIILLDGYTNLKNICINNKLITDINNILRYNLDKFFIYSFNNFF